MVFMVFYLYQKMQTLLELAFIWDCILKFGDGQRKIDFRAKKTCDHMEE